MSDDIVARMRESIFLGNIHHAYAQTDGTYAFPNSREGDMLKQAVREFLAMREDRDEIERLRSERDEARRRTNSILTEIDCRIEHGAESNGHLEVLRDMFKENTDE